MTPTIIKRYNNGGTIEIYKGFKHRGDDYERIYTCCKHFAKQGKRAIIMPSINYKDPIYQVLYKDLIGTQYERKCPDICVDGVFYEHEGFCSSNHKKAFLNMMKRGTKQSSRIIIEDCGITERYVKRWCVNIVVSDKHIEELLVIDRTGNIRTIFSKKQ